MMEFTITFLIVHYIVLVVPALTHEEANNTSSYRKYIIYFLTNHSLFYMCLHETVVELASIFDNYMCFWDDLAYIVRKELDGCWFDYIPDTLRNEWLSCKTGIDDFISFI